jgi:uncharacterized protein (DUF58 family)
MTRGEPPAFGGRTGASLARLVPEWHIRITNFGLGYILLTLLVAIAATNTGNNGLYAVLAGLLAAMVVSGVISRRNIRALECRVEVRGEAFAGDPVAISVTVRNRSRSLTAQGIWFLHEGLPGPLFLDPIGPRQEATVLVDAVFRRRGAYTRFDSGLMSRFPIGLFRKYADARYPREILIFPRPVRSRAFEPPLESTRGGSSASRLKGHGAEVRTFREFASGDDLRDLHWKVSARMQKWIVREREDERSRAVVLVVDNVVSDVLSPAELEGAERRISKAAGEALALLARGGEAGLAARGLWLAPGSGRAQRQAILEALARLPIFGPEEAPPLPPPRRGETRRSVAA